MKWNGFVSIFFIIIRFIVVRFNYYKFIELNLELIFVSVNLINYFFDF